ncbi:zeta-crystallin [Lentithecium fluviatile CBS 122367]|uniref:Zeta-crystallin n=1 Tax=Lentithecium fluviatile CBS 122367 TaxID=1168545 RepID=A0A6G1IYN0_9PLEO|nr:zeta-crystallin [Lentithecium fluviatile CBS 122367]
MEAILISKFVKDLRDLKVAKDVQLVKAKSSSDLHIRITHAAVTHVDQLYAQGLHQNNRRHIQPPFILGTEFAGIVTTAPHKSQFKPGDRVFGGSLGAYAESIVVDEKSVRKVPDRWTLAQACALGGSGNIGYGALISVAKLTAGETALILGASGGLGVMAVQIAKAVGAKVIAVVGDGEKAKMIRELGADEVVSYREANWEESVRDKTSDGEGVHVVYDLIGAVQSSLKCLRYRGRIVIVGFAARKGKMEEVAMNRILLKSAMVHGYRYGEDGRRDPSRTQEVWDGFMKLVEEGGIKPVPYKEGYNGLEEVGSALEDVKLHRTWGRAVLTIDGTAEAAQKARL